MDPREIKEKATQLFTKGKFAKAAETFEEYCKADVRDVQARLRMGDAWAKAGKKDRAVHAYTSAAEGFAKEGFLPRAIAASKLILELDPTHQGVQKMLADLYARKSGSSRPVASPKALGSTPVAAPVVEAPLPAVEIQFEDEPRAKLVASAPPPAPPSAQVAAWELPPPAPIEIEVEDASSGAGEVEIDIVSADVEVPVSAPEPELAPPAPPGLNRKTEARMTELERSLEAFAHVEVSAGAQKVAAASSFTELEFEGDSLLQAVEAAAGKPFASSPSISVTTEEAMEAVEEPKLEPGALPKIPLFSDLPAEAFIALFEQCPLRRAEPGDVLIEQGSQGESFFVICSGSAKVFREDDGKRRELATLEEGAFFGEMALLSDAPRSASVEAAADDTQLLEISAAVLTDLSRMHPTIATALKKFCRQRLLANLMNGATLFRPFTKTERRDLVQKFRARDVNRGETLIREGERSDGLYVILTGEVGVRVQGQSVATLKEGDVFGEMSLLTRTAATATVQTLKKTSLLRLPREDFDAIIMSHPQILELVAELTDARTRKNAELLKSKANAQSVV